MNEDTGVRRPRWNGVGAISSIAEQVRGYFLRLMRSHNGENTVRGALEELIEEHPDAETPIVEEQRTLPRKISSICVTAGLRMLWFHGPTSSQST